MICYIASAVCIQLNIVIFKAVSVFTWSFFFVAS